MRGYPQEKQMALRCHRRFVRAVSSLGPPLPFASRTLRHSTVRGSSEAEMSSTVSQAMRRVLPGRHQAADRLSGPDLPNVQPARLPRCSDCTTRQRLNALDRAGRKESYPLGMRGTDDPSIRIQRDRLDRSHQGRWCFGKTPMQTFLDAMPMTKEKMIAA